MALGQRLAEERKRLGMSQDAFSKHLGVGRSALGMIETGRSGLDAERLAELGKTLGVDVTYVMTGEPAAIAVAAQINWSLVESILKGLYRWADRHRIKLTPERTRLALSVLYRHFAARGVVDDAVLDDTLDLAA